MKRLAFLLLLPLLALSSWASVEINGIYYELNSSSKTATVVSSSSGYTGSIQIPLSVTYGSQLYYVTEIGDNAFKNCSGLTKISIPKSVTSIGASAFYNCTGLTSVTIPNSVTNIGNNAFDNCIGLTKVTLNSNAITSKKYTSSSGIRSIFGSQVNEYIIGESVTSIGNHAFYNCKGLTSITIPNSVTSIGYNAFCDCTGLTSVTIGSSVTSIGFGAFYNCTGLTSVTIGSSVTSIGTSAFYNCTGLTSVTIPNSVTSIGDGAFSGCEKLTSITIPNSVTSIGDYAFYNCKGLTSVTIPNSVTSIGNSAFSYCKGLTKVTLNSNAVASKTYTSSSKISGIFGSQVKEYIIGESVTSIGDYAFSGCTGLTSIIIPNSLTNIGTGAFNDCSNLTKVILNSNSIVSKHYSISSNIVNCFGTQVKEYVLGNSITHIGEAAFAGSLDLMNINIPQTVTCISPDAFYYCPNLKQVVVERNDPEAYQCSEMAFCDNSELSNLNTIKLIVPQGSASAYQNLSPWSYFLIEEGTTTSTTIPAISISLNQTTATLTKAGETMQLTATVLPEGASNKSVTWRSNNTSVATVSETGLVTAVANGTATITATTNDGSNKSATCKVTVSNQGHVVGTFHPVSRVSMIVPGKEYMIYNSAWSTGTYSDRWGFVYDNNKIAINGLSVPESFQTSDNAYLWTFEDAGDGKYYVMNVESGNYAGTGTTMSDTPVAFTIASFVDCPKKGDDGSRSDDGTRIESENITASDKLFYIYNGEKYWNGNNYWTSGVDGFATWSKAHPYAIYEVQSVGGTDTPVLATGISLSQTTLTLTSVGQRATLTATVTPSNATNKSVTWRSSNTNIATVSETGLVTAVANGTATITATTADGSNLSATCDVNVSASSSDEGDGITIIVSPATGECLRFGSSPVSGAGSYYNTWKSTSTTPQLTLSTPKNDMWIHTDDSSVHYYGGSTFSISVPSGYFITGYSFDFVGYEGNNNSYTTRREMTVRDADNNNYGCTTTTSGHVEVTDIETDSTYFNVVANGNILVTNFIVTISTSKVAATGVRLNKTTATLTSAGSTVQLTATVFPEGASNKSVTWRSNNTSVATVSETGLVTAVANGTATITATTADGTRLSASCTVTVDIASTSSIPGDVNEDGDVDVADIVAVINYVLAASTDAAGDVNEDGDVDVADIVAVINYVLSYNGTRPFDPAIVSDTRGMNSHSDYSLLSATANAQCITLAMDGGADYTAFQFVLTLPDEADLTDVVADADRLGSHQLMFMEIGEGRYFVLGYDDGNSTITGESGTLLNLFIDNQSGTATISDVVFSTPDAQKHRMQDISVLMATGVGSLSSACSDGNVYDVHGRCVMTEKDYKNHGHTLPAGVYIRNGKKFIIR